MNKDRVQEVGGELEAIRTRIEDAMARGKFTWAELQDAVGKRGREAARFTDALVHDNAWKSIGVAVGVGVALGVILPRLDVVQQRSTEGANGEARPDLPWQAVQSTILFVLSTMKAVRAFRGI